MQPVYSKPEEKKPEPATKMLGTGMAAQAAGFLRGRKAQIDAASNYANGGMVKNYMDGGMVRGPGTGTSDDVPAMVRPGSYVMPADSTKAMGFKPEARRVNLSNGEMVLTPEQTAAIGVKNLDKFKKATHKMAPMKSESANYVNGGMVEPYVNWREPNRPGPRPIQALGYTPNTAVAPNTRPNFTMPPQPPSTSRALAVVPQPVTQNFIMGETPEFKAAQEAKRAAAAAEAAYGDRVNPVPKDNGRFGLPPNPPINGPAPPPAPQRPGLIAAARDAVNTPMGRTGRVATGLLAPLGGIIEGVNTAQVAMDPNSTGTDVASQAAGGAGKLAAGFLGAKGGAAAGSALGALGGPLAPFTVPLGGLAGSVVGGIGGYMAADKAIEAGRSALGTETADPVERIAATTPSPTMEARAAEAPTTPAVTPPVGAPPPPSATPAPAPATPGATEVRPGIFRQGNSFSDTAAGAEAGARPNVISPQNMAAADALAQRSAARNPLVAAAQQQMGGGNITPRTSGSGFGLLDQGARDRRAAMMDAQQMKPGAKEALAALLRQQGEAPGLELKREGMEMDQQNKQADLGFRREELGARMGDAAATRDLRSQELADNMQTNAVRRDAAAVELATARQMQALQQEYLSAKTPQEQEAAARKLQALQGKDAAANRFTVVPGGQEIQTIGGLPTPITRPAMVFNNQTGQFVTPQGQGAQAQGSLPPGMTRQVGTSGGKPVYEDANGRRFVAE